MRVPVYFGPDMLGGRGAWAIEMSVSGTRMCIQLDQAGHLAERARAESLPLRRLS